VSVDAADHLIRDEAALTALYGAPAANSIRKEVPVLTPAYRAVIEASPFCTLATSGWWGRRGPTPPASCTSRTNAR
jgi:predicted pyridoxine 5'-phosphate oxidase superfamily flavin-nucleotide-binding protein